MSLPQLRPLGVGEILDVGIRIYRRNFRVLVLLVLVVVLPVEVVSALLQASASADEPFVTETGQIVIDDDFWTSIAGFASATLLSFLGGILATGACYKAIADGYLGERAEWRGSLGYALRHAHSIIWLTFLSTLLIILGFVLLVVPGVYLIGAFAVAVPVLMTEGLRGRRALGRSRRLVRGRWWGSIGVVVLGGILVAIVQGALVGLATAATLTDAGSDTAASFVTTTSAYVLASVLATPLSAAFVTVLYFDLRVRREAFDLQLLARQIGVDPSALAPTAEPPAPAAPSLGDDDVPPYWPPPPGWRPRRDEPE